MGKSNNHVPEIATGLLTAFATICAALISGIFLLWNTRIGGHSTPAPQLTTIPTMVSQPTDIPWVPGQTNPDHAHVVASNTSGKWVPENGYDWADPNDESNWSVVWSPGKVNQDHPNVVASDTEGNWLPAPGYKWVNPDNVNDFTVSRVLGEIQNVQVDHNVTKDNQKGMRIHVKFRVDELKDIRCYIGAYFYNADTGEPLQAKPGDYSTPNSEVVVGSDFIPQYKSTTFNDFVLFIPYDALNIDPSIKSIKLKFVIKLYNWRDENFISTSDEFFVDYSQ